MNQIFQKIVEPPCLIGSHVHRKYNKLIYYSADIFFVICEKWKWNLDSLDWDCAYLNPLNEMIKTKCTVEGKGMVSHALHTTVEGPRKQVEDAVKHQGNVTTSIDKMYWN